MAGEYAELYQRMKEHLMMTQESLSLASEQIETLSRQLETQKEISRLGVSDIIWAWMNDQRLDELVKRVADKRAFEKTIKDLDSSIELGDYKKAYAIIKGLRG